MQFLLPISAGGFGMPGTGEDERLGTLSLCVPSALHTVDTHANTLCSRETGHKRTYRSPLASVLFVSGTHFQAVSCLLSTGLLYVSALP